MENELSKIEIYPQIASIYGNEESAEWLLSKFQEHISVVTGDWEKKVKSIVVTDASQTDLMRMAREARLLLQKTRTNADKLRKELKEDSLKQGKAIQDVYNWIEKQITPLEEHCKQQEQFAEIQEAKRLADLQAKRVALIEPYAAYVSVSQNFSNMDESVFNLVLQGAKNAKQTAEEQAKKDAEEAAERERLAKEQAEKERAELEKQRAENARVAAEQAAERERLAKERAEIDRIERERLAEKLKEQRRIELEQEQAQKLANAGDNEKLAMLAASLRGYELPSVTGVEAKQTLEGVSVLLGKIANFIEGKIK